ncbi:MAG: protein phosphatase CheZ [Gallionella sp.]|nr:protein phosphatase CheZ [Gallionella sp.]
MATNTANQDTDDLEALFDSILEANNAENTATILPITPVAAEARAPESNGKVINQIGHLARTLHDTLCELGLNKEIERAASSIPDARDRLNYVATLTQQAAERVLNATEAAQPVVSQIEGEAQRLAQQWDLLFDKKLDVASFKALVLSTVKFLHGTPRDTRVINSYLVEIMMAQDFQDLTGQVIKKVITVTQDMEKELLSLLIENAPAGVKAEMNSGLLNGPVVQAEGRNDVVTSQDQVDDLLESLGF